LTVYTVYSIFRNLYMDPTTFFAALSHQTRLRCLLLLLAHGELCVCELTHALGIAQPAMSRHLALLRDGGLVLDRREGLWIHYRVHPDLPEWALDVLRDTAAGVARSEPYAADAAALADMPNRPGASRCA
jgi:ArsR family transcriptional regulator